MMLLEQPTPISCCPLFCMTLFFSLLIVYSHTGLLPQCRMHVLTGCVPSTATHRHATTWYTMAVFTYYCCPCHCTLPHAATQQHDILQWCSPTTAARATTCYTA